MKEKSKMINFSIAAICNLFSKLFDFQTVKTEHQAETEIIEDKDRLEEALNIAEDILLLAVRYKSSMSKKDQKQLLKLIKKFKKVN